MTIQELARMGESHFRLLDNKIFGVHDEIPYTITGKTKGAKTTFTITFSLSKGVPTKVVRAMRGMLPPKTSIIVNNYGTFTLTTAVTAEDDGYAIISTILDTVTNTLQSGAKPIGRSDTCPHCKKADCDSAAVVGINFVPVHQACVISANEKQANATKKLEREGNYLTGIIGALLGALIGCIPYLVSLVALEYDLSLFYFLIPLASFKGYQIAQGKLGGGARLIVILSSIFAYCFSFVLTLYLYQVITYGVDIGFFNLAFTYIYFTPFFDLIQIHGFGVVCLVIGLFSSFSAIGKTTKDTIQEITNSVESIMSLDGSYQPPVYTTIETPVVEGFAPTYSSEKPPMDLDI